MTEQLCKQMTEQRSQETTEQRAEELGEQRPQEMTIQGSQEITKQCSLEVIKPLLEVVLEQRSKKIGECRHLLTQLLIVSLFLKNIKGCALKTLPVDAIWNVSCVEYEISLYNFVLQHT